MDFRITCLKLCCMSLMLLLTSCQLPAEVEVTQLADGRILINATSDATDKPCINSVSISHEVGGSFRPDWSISEASAPDQDICVSQFTYPDVPRYFAADEHQNALQSGVAYRVEVSGSGLRGATTFVRIPLAPQTR